MDKDEIEKLEDANLHETNEIYATCCVFSVFFVGVVTYVIIDYLT